jgi:methionine-rich copper-binding protein CopC
MQVLRTTLLLAAVALSSCSKFSLLTQPLEGSANVEVRSLQAGSVLSPQDTVTFRIRAEEGGKYSLQIHLTDPAGNSIWESTLESPQLNEELELQLPEELPVGQYQLHFRIVGETGTAGEKSYSFFYAPGEYRVLGIQSYPPSLLPGTSMTLKAQLQVPEAADPYIRWTLGDTVIARGLLSAGLDEVAWPAPAQEGIYVIRVEMFPVPPAAGAEYPFRAVTSLDAQLYVTNRSALTDSDLSPPESYYSLFHFNGDLSDSARGSAGAGAATAPATGRPAGSASRAEAIGAPQLVAVQESVGYRLQAPSGLRLPRWILPTVDGTLQPFTLTLGLILDPSAEAPQAGAGPAPDLQTADAPQAEPLRDLLTVRSREEDDFRFLLQTGPKELQLTLQSGSEQAVFASGFPQPADGREHFISVSIVPSAEALQVQWFLDGRQTAGYTQPLTLRELSGAGESLIGGPGGFSGVITELGVYCRDPMGRPATDPAVYRRAMERRHRQALLLADGFDGLFLSAGLLPEGAVRLARGDLLLESAGVLELPSVELDAEGLTLELALSDALPAQGRLSLLWKDTGQPLLELSTSGRIFFAGREEALAGTDWHDLRLELSPSPSGAADLSLLLSSGKLRKSLTLPAAQPPSAGLRIRLQNPSAEGPPLRLDRLLLLRGREPG